MCFEAEGALQNNIECHKADMLKHLHRLALGTLCLATNEQILLENASGECVYLQVVQHDADSFVVNANIRLQYVEMEGWSEQTAAALPFGAFRYQQSVTYNSFNISSTHHPRRKQGRNKQHLYSSIIMFLPSQCFRTL